MCTVPILQDLIYGHYGHLLEYFLLRIIFATECPIVRSYSRNQTRVNNHTPYLHFRNQRLKNENVAACCPPLTSEVLGLFASSQAALYEQVPDY